MSDNSLHRVLKTRHLTMMALGGSIGTGLFLASGNSIVIAGPGGAVLGYLLMGLMVYFLMTSLGEMSALLPNTGAFCDYSERFVSPSFGFAMGYNYFYNWAITIAVNLTAASILMRYWFPNVAPGIWAGSFLVLLSLINLLHVKIYGESEYWLSLIKITAVILFIIIGTLMIVGLTGSAPIGIQNWRIPGAPFHGGLWGVISVFLVVGFSFQGTELVGVAAGEVENPKENIPKAIRNVFWRILIFYVLAILIIASIIPYNHPNLIGASSGNVSMSPFTMVFSSAGFKFAGSLVNWVMVTAVLSACNSSIYTATRTLWFLSKQGHAPKQFSAVSTRGVPYKALWVSMGFGGLTLLLWVFNEDQLFNWLVNLSALAGFIAWFGIAWSHYRFRQAYLLQGKSLSDLPYQAKFFPLGPALAGVLCLFVIIGQALLSPLTWQNLLSNYLGLLIFLGLWGIHYWIKRDKMVALKDCRFDP